MSEPLAAHPDDVRRALAGSRSPGPVLDAWATLDRELERIGVGPANRRDLAGAVFAAVMVATFKRGSPRASGAGAG